ncbi:MAG: FG-GAP-like repeat-containing protein [Gilvibacter sp.]
MKKNITFLIAVLIQTAIVAQVTFTDKTSDLVNSGNYSGVAMAINDLNNDGLDDVVRLLAGQDLRIDFQQADGSFVGYSASYSGSSSAWGMAIADIDENGFNDIIVGGAYNSLTRWSANATGTAYTQSSVGGPSIFLQNSNFADINNDGAIDYFACHDDGLSSPYQNNGTGTLTHTASLINTASTVPSDNSGNYGSIWTDYDNDGDLDLYISKCRLGVNTPTDGRRLNLLFQNDGSNNFTEVAPAANLQPLGQSWATGFGDLDNDGDFDAVIINHDPISKSRIYANDGDGTFTDISSTVGVTTELQTSLGQGIQVMMDDFDNDTYLDILLTTRSGTHYIFYNDGDMTFTASSPFFSTSTDIQSGATGDLNNDGFVDVIAGFAGGYNSPNSGRPDKMFINNGNSNNWTKVDLKGVQSNINGIAAKVLIEGAWGSQVREVRAGESYGTQNSFTSHFGLGTATAIDKITVQWPSGLTDVLLNPAINERILIMEGETCQASTTWNGSMWDNGAPSETVNAIIQGTYDTGTDGDIIACSLLVKDGFTLTIDPTGYAEITKNITVEVGAGIDVLNTASIVQINDDAQAVNNGTIRIYKQTPSLDNRDFMIVGSPMSMTTNTVTFAGAEQFRDHTTANFNADSEVTAEDGAALNFADTEGDDWQHYTGTLSAGQGYLVMPQTATTVPDGQTYIYEFNQGTLNNGVVNFAVIFGDDQNDSPNVLSNPYASAIDANLLIAQNSSMINTLYFWEHITPPSVGYPGYYPKNYDMGDISMFSGGSGGVAANGGTPPTGYIASGQGFAIKALAAGTAVFNNSMRVTGNNDDYRFALINKDRIWLNVSNADYEFKSQMLVAFVAGATANFEPYYDSHRLATPVAIYSQLSTGEQLAIQGRGRFDLEDRIAIGFRTQIEQELSYTISIHQIEQAIIPADAQVYLKDNYSGLITNLTTNDYHFRSSEGDFSDRFELFFKEAVLGVDAFDQGFVMYPNPANDEVVVWNSTNFEAKMAQIFDATGRLVLVQNFGNSNIQTIAIGTLPAGLYYVSIGNTTKKLVVK